MRGWLSRQRLRIALEASLQRRAVVERDGEHLQRDHVPEPRIARAIDLTHSARADGVVTARES